MTGPQPARVTPAEISALLDHARHLLRRRQPGRADHLPHPQDRPAGTGYIAELGTRRPPRPASEAEAA